MGRERIAKRLADLAFKMAADNLCSSESVLDHQKRPVYVAFFNKKLPCPQTFYKDKRYCFTKMASFIIFVQFTKNSNLQTRSFVRQKHKNAPLRRNIAMVCNASKHYFLICESDRHLLFFIQIFFLTHRRSKRNYDMRVCMVNLGVFSIINSTSFYLSIIALIFSFVLHYVMEYSLKAKLLFLIYRERA